MVHSSKNGLWRLMGLQFFAEAAADAGGSTGAAADTGADGGSAGVDEFMDGLLGGDGENKPAVVEAPPQDSVEQSEQGTPAQEEEPQQEQNTEGGDSHEEAERGQTQTLPLTVSGKTVEVDAAAVQTLARSLGTTPQSALEMLQKGMNYEQKNSREMSILTDYAQEAGMTLAQYVEQLEQQKDAVLLQKEMQRAAEELPEGTPEEALQRIAQANLNERKQVQAREAREAQHTREQAENTQRVDGWKALFAERPALRNPENVPEEIFTMVAQRHCTPSEALARIEAQQTAQQLEQAKAELAAAQKNNSNRKTAPGAMGSAGNVEVDPFLSGLMG